MLSDELFTPSRPLDAFANDVIARGRAIRRRARLRHRSAVAVVAVAALSTVGVVFSHGEPRVGVQTTERSQPSATAPPEVPPPTQPANPATPRRTAPARGGVTEGRDGATAPPEAPPERETAAVEGCSVYSRPDETTGPVMGPGPPDAVRECSYTATVAAGYSGSGTWTLDVTRNGRTFTLDSTTSPACQPTGVIRAGDRVALHLGVRMADGGYSQFSAGSGEWRLDAGTWIEDC